MSYATRLATGIRNAYDAHDRDHLERELARMVAALEYTGPLPEGWVPPKSRPEPGSALAWPGPAAREALREQEACNALNGCGRKAANCECASDHERAICMYRKAPPPKDGFFTV